MRRFGAASFAVRAAAVPAAAACLLLVAPACTPDAAGPAVPATAPGTGSSPAPPPADSSPALDFDSAWLSEVESRIAASQFAFRPGAESVSASPDAGGGGTWLASNRVHGLDARFASGAVQILPYGAGAAGTWRLDLRLTPASPLRVPPREGACRDDGAVDPEGYCLRRLEYERGDGVTEWWTNSAEGLRQGFTVDAAPWPGTGVSPIVLEISWNSEHLQAVRPARPNAFEWQTPSGARLRYADVRAWDAGGEPLAASLTEPRPGQLRISVDGTLEDGSPARYPVTVDPLLTALAWQEEPDSAFAEFGSSVSTAGDVDGDGFADVIVGARYYTNGEASEGGAWVYEGSEAGLATTAAWQTQSNSVGAYYGSSVAAAGDVNGDGFGDVVVGAPGYFASLSTRGAIYVYHGSSSGLSTTVARFNMGSPGNLLGTSVAGAGDVNGDGYGDVVVGDPGYDLSSSLYDVGRVLVYQGSSAGIGTAASSSIVGSNSDSQFGQTVDTAGDVNGDGYNDIVFGQPGWPDPADMSNDDVGEGRAYLHLGSSAGVQTTAIWTLSGSQSGQQLGSAVAGVGDTNGDGYSDVLVGSNLYDNGENNEGIVLLFLSTGSTLAATSAWSYQSNQVSAQLGDAVAPAGDVNGDGRADVIVGCQLWANGNPNEGAALVFLGNGTGLQNTPIWSAEGNANHYKMGASVASAGDVNGDGFSDVIVGEIGYDNGQTDEGAALVYYGSGSTLSSTAYWSGESNLASSGYGTSVAGAGDVDGDGYDDVLVDGRIQLGERAFRLVGRRRRRRGRQRI
jgi:hypothetical protein